LAAAGAPGRPAGAKVARGRPAAAAGQRRPRGAARAGCRGQRGDARRVRGSPGGAHRRAGEPAGALPGAATPRLAAQKKTLRASEQDQAAIAAERAAYRQRVDAIGPERLVFLDESGVTTKMTRRFARAPRGQRALGSVPFGGWRRLTVIGALSCEGMVAAMSVEASINAALFLVYLDEVLVPELRRRKPDAVLVMDNLRPHHATAVAETLARAHLGLLYLPRYSPDLSPIEPGWSKVKTRLRAKAVRSAEALDEELRPTLDAITPQDAKGWFRHCGYALN
jgi:transposase